MCICGPNFWLDCLLGCCLLSNSFTVSNSPDGTAIPTSPSLYLYLRASGGPFFQLTVQLSLCRNFCRISFVVFFQGFSLALHRTCPAHAPTRACVLLLTGDKLEWGSRSINISEINIRKQRKSDPT